MKIYTTGTRHCIHCPNFINEIKSNIYPGYIGRCNSYDQLVKDALCGCKIDGEKTILLNFGKESSE